MTGFVAVADARTAARRRLPRAIFDFVDGGADGEVSLRRNRDQFDDIAFHPRVGVDVAERDQSVVLFGRRYAAPFGIAPTGLAGLVRPQAEKLLARAAAAAGVPMVLSTVASCSLEDVARAADSPKWFQLYILRDRGLTRGLMARAQAAGYAVLVVTLDCAVGGRRERDPRNDFTLPLRLTARNAIDVLRRPGWAWNMLRHGPPRPENMIEGAGGISSAEGLTAFMTSQLDPAVTWADVAALRRDWPGPMVVKGIACVEDARCALDCGADGVILSNHGGRQLDTVVPPLAVLPGVADALGDRLTILCDSGFRRGADVVKALALGARAVLFGRPTLYGLAARGEAGAARVLALFRDDVDRTLALLGCRSVAELGRRHVGRAVRSPEWRSTGST